MLLVDAVLIEHDQRRCELKTLNDAPESARERLVAEHAQITATGEGRFERLFRHPTDLTALLPMRARTRW